MKRSDMMEIIWTFIQDVECDYDFYMEYDDASRLLDLMEKCGMKHEYWEGDSFHGGPIKGFEPEFLEKGSIIQLNGGAFTIPESGMYKMTSNSITKVQA